MKTKKTPRADLEKKKILFLEIGFVITLCVVLYSFEWGTSETSQFTVTTGYIEPDTEIIDITRPEPPKPEVKLPEPQPVAPIINIVEDDDPDDDLSNLDNPEDDDPVDPIIHNFTNEDPPETTEIIPWSNVEVKPSFIGGEAAMLKFIAENTMYPLPAKDNGIQGTVYVSFVIGADGKVNSVSIARGVHSSLDNEALRVVAMLPRWNPGKQREIPVSVSYIIPIKFVLY